MNNNLQNPLQVLRKKSQAAWSGCIEIEEPNDLSVSWHVYLLEGKVIYITSKTGQLERTNYLWQKFKLGTKCPRITKKDSSEYDQLCKSLSDRPLSEIDVKKLLFRFTREGFVNVLSIKQTTINLIPAKRIKKPLISFTLQQLGAKSEEQLKRAKYVRGFLGSPFRRLHLEQKNALKFYQSWKPKCSDSELEVIFKNHKLSSFVSLFVAKSCLYQIAAKINVDTYFLATHLKQSIAEELIDLHLFKELSSEEIKQKQQSQRSNPAQENKSGSSRTNKPSDPNATLIVCVDDSKTVQTQVRRTLEAGGYRVLGILDPTTALKKLSQHQPAVIFLDINMPNLNGYDLCSLLRKSQRFKDIPIVMLTGRDGMIDRVRAKLVGATDYLTKPCDPNKLITLTQALEKSKITV